MRGVSGSVNIFFKIFLLPLFPNLCQLGADSVEVSRTLCGVFLEASTPYFKVFLLPSFGSLPVGADLPE